MKLLLGSGGLRTQERLQIWQSTCDEFLTGIQKVLFIPYALADYGAYVEKIRNSDFHAGRQVIGIHECADPKTAIHEAEAISVGGGNTFLLLETLQHKGLLEPIRSKIMDGAPYVGVSAGTNLACPTIKTTNDMPIVWPTNLDALNFIPFQINAHFFSGPIHYLDDGGQLIPYGGETRLDRIREFHEQNGAPVLGLPEGMILKVNTVQSEDAAQNAGQNYRLIGKGRPYWFVKGSAPVPLSEGSWNPST